MTVCVLCFVGNSFNGFYAVEFRGDKPDPQARAIMETPLVDITTPHCLMFDYTVKSALSVWKQNPKEVVTLSDSWIS